MPKIIPYPLNPRSCGVRLQPKILLPVFFLLLLRLAAAAQTTYHKPELPANADFGRGLTRTMHLLASSTPEKRNTVRILVYGQSISQQEWWKEVKRDLEERFPHADLIMENRAIGGFSVPRLNRPAEHDVYPFYPDLVIFHVYGGQEPYEELIKEIRTRTTAEIALQNDHIGPTQNQEFHDRHSYEWLPDLARRYGLEMMDIRGPWTAYLKKHNLQPRDLLKDDIHLNDHGNFLLAELIKRRFVYRPELPVDPLGTVTTYVVGKDVKFKRGTLTLPFTGNRVDLVAAPLSPLSVPLAVQIDGQQPSQFPGTYAITRPGGDLPGWPWQVGSHIRVSHREPLLPEDWTLTITRINAAADTFAFEVRGSVTGPDGGGTNLQTFVSNSGRVVIEPRDWWMKEAVAHSKITVPVGHQLKWSVVPLHHDRFVPGPVNPWLEQATTVAQGLPNTVHTLVLKRERKGRVPIRAIRVYRPPGAGQETKKPAE
jgi:hypothetical protein